MANVVNQEFMSAIDKQCSLCGDDAEKLLEYLGQGQGLILLLSLVIYADKVC